MTNAPPTDERRVLVIDDTESIHSDFRKILGASHGSGDSLAAAKTALFGDAVSECAPRCSFSITSAMQGQQGVQLAADARGGNRPFHVAFVDMRMPPGWDGITTIRRLWEADSELQVVISTAYSDHDLEHLPEDLKPEGRLLVLKKPFDPAEVLHLAATLSAKWRAEREAAAKMENLERMVQERIADIEFASLHDRLTGLPNRTLLNDRISMCIERHSRNPECKFAILFLDFDRFKLINDSMGHEVGDLLLIEIANRLRASIRTADTVAQDTIAARHGGDEFIVLLQDLREERDAARVAQRVLDVLSEPYVLDGQRVFSTASIGIATSDRGYQSPADMIRDADTAMYRAKAAGRARYVMFDSHMHAEVVRRLSLESSLRQAIRSDSIDLHYQPLLQLSNGDLNGFEALVRFRHPERGPVPAAEIIAIAEETGLIQPLSMCVFRKACAQLREWRDRYPAMQNLVMSINFSRKQLIDPDVTTHILEIVRGAGVPPSSLMLEITESALLEDTRAARVVFDQLKDLGVWLYLDDFGTGSSSLSCLYTIPLSGLKIDRDFMGGLSTHPGHKAVFEAIVNIARAFNLKIVAEGIETTEQYELLRRLKVDYGQGYLLGKPVSAEQAERLLSGLPTLCHV